MLEFHSLPALNDDPDIEICDLDSESGVIASLIQDPELIFHFEQLQPSHFTKADNRTVYKAIQKLTDKGITTADPYNIIEILYSDPKTRVEAEMLSVEKLNNLAELSNHIARRTPEEYKVVAGNVLDAAFRRDMLKKLRECAKECHNPTDKNIVGRIYGQLDDVMMEYSYVDEVPEIGEVIDDVWADVVRHQDGRAGGIPFKFPTLNDFVTIEPGELVVVAAPMKGAKSMFMLNEAIDILRQGKTVMYIDSELSTRLFVIRMVSHLTGIEFARVRSGNYSEEEQKRIEEARDWIRKQKLVHLYMPIFDQKSIYTAVKKVSHRFASERKAGDESDEYKSDSGIDVLIVDYLKSTGNTEAFATYQELGRLTDLIKNDIAGKMKIAALAAAQLTATNKLADSAKIARNASTVLLLLNKTPEEREADGPECGNKKLIVQFNRNGMQHPDGDYIDIYFDGDVIKLSEAKKHVQTDPF